MSWRNVIAGVAVAACITATFALSPPPKKPTPIQYPCWTEKSTNMVFETDYPWNFDYKVMPIDKNKKSSLWAKAYPMVGRWPKMYIGAGKSQMPNPPAAGAGKYKWQIKATNCRFTIKLFPTDKKWDPNRLIYVVR